MTYTIAPPFFVTVENDFRVGSGFESVARCLQFSPKLNKVIYFTVENQLQPAIFVRNRLRAAIQIDNAQAPMAQADFSIQKRPLTIGATMSND